MFPTQGDMVRGNAPTARQGVRNWLPAIIAEVVAQPSLAGLAAPWSTWQRS